MLRKTLNLSVRDRPFSMQMDPVFISPRKRYSHDFMYKGEGKTNSGFKQPYRIWSWKQRELFRNVQEAQFEHMRRVYKRQWLEAYRVNAGEYIYKYNQTKAAQLVQWENEMETQEMKRREAYQGAAGRQALRAKHIDLLREYHEKNFFAWYERASERLQYMAQTMKFLDKDDLDAHLEKELNKYTFEPNRSYPLNFCGQMPLLEDKDGQVVAAASHAFTRSAQHELAGLQKYDAPTMSAQEANALAESISGNLRGVYSPSATTTASGDAADDADATASASDLLNDELAAQVVDQMAAEEQAHMDDAHGGGEQREDKVGNLDEDAYQRRRRMYLDRGKSAAAKRAQLFAPKKPGFVQAKAMETIHDTDTTVAEAETQMGQALATERGNETKKRKHKRDKKDLKRQEMLDALSANEKQLAGAGAIGGAVPGGADDVDDANLTRSEKHMREMMRSSMRHADLEAALMGAHEAARAEKKGGAEEGESVRATNPKLTDELLQKLMDKTGGGISPSGKGASPPTPPKK